MEHVRLETVYSSYLYFLNLILSLNMNFKKSSNINLGEFVYK
jgi:hypothetical protein